MREDQRPVAVKVLGEPEGRAARVGKHRGQPAAPPAEAGAYPPVNREEVERVQARRRGAVAQEAVKMRQALGA